MRFSISRLGLPRTVALAALALALPAAMPARAQFMHTPLKEIAGIDQKLDSQVPLDATFRDDTGKTVRLADYFGKRPVILTMVYYECPMLCTLILNGVEESIAKIPFDVGKEYEVVTISINPKETPELAARKKEAYLEKYNRPGAAEGWHFLTGEADAIHKVADAVGFRYAYDDKTAQYVHASGIMVLTPKGRVARYFYGIEYPPRDLRLGLVEASSNKIGSRVDQVLLYCFHYDPAKGKYGIVVMNVIRAAGLATVLGLGTLMLVLLRRERREHPHRP